MKLKDKFKKVFISSLIFGIIASIILTILILVYFFHNFIGEDLVDTLGDLEKGIIESVIFTASNLLGVRLLVAADQLALFRRYYEFYSSRKDAMEMVMAMVDDDSFTFCLNNYD